ncbi:GNAT family N-acetyltransferase [Lacticigenium naphthae]|uniref:GNAT family N-acetyltransferase n=1 Tax=Lacticigenium naphthae TaxID=515351 RepID=UPI0003FE9803|nr:GNAT family N-acetyltransferase [Lacticigenium naphthae]
MNLYFNEKYGKLYKTHEKATTDTFCFKNKYGEITNMFLKKEIPYKIDKQIYYDIFTPYGFGGPVIMSTTDKDKLVRDYLEAFSSYCIKKNIVSEFVRYHPIENDDIRSKFNGKVERIGKQIIRNLHEPSEKNISKRMLKYYKKNIKEGMEVIFDDTGDYLDDFLEIYYSTMDRNNADEYYYFKRSFFENIHKELKDHFFYTHIFMDGTMIASGLILYDKVYAYAFLGGTREGFYECNSNVNVEIETIKRLKEKNISYYLLGGGHKGEDGIYQFKKKFAKNSDYDYYVGKKIHHNDVYKKMVKRRFKMNVDQVDTSFFPVYRADITQLEEPIRSLFKSN